MDHTTALTDSLHPLMNFIQANQQRRVYGSTRAQLDNDTVNSPKRRVLQAGDSVTATASKTSRQSASTVVAQPRQQQGGDDDDCPTGRDYSYRHGRLHPLLSIRHHTSLCQRMHECSSFAMIGSLACSRQPPRFSPGRSKAQRRHHGNSWHTLELPLISGSTILRGKILMTSPAGRLIRHQGTSFYSNGNS